MARRVPDSTNDSSPVQSSGLDTMVDNNFIPHDDYGNDNFDEHSNALEPLQHINTEEILLTATMGSQETFNCIESFLTSTGENFPSSQVTPSQAMSEFILPESSEITSDLIIPDKKPDPEHWYKFPELKEFPGDVMFDVEIRGPSNQSTWTYSPELKKIFIKINTLLNLQVSYNANKCWNKMFLRAMIVYPDFDYLPVIRCNNHKVQNKINPEKPGRESHIIRCPHENVHYCGNEEGRNFIDRLSLYFPLDTSGTIKSEDGDRVKTSVMMEFTCQNSCPTGINRRATVLSVTLEDDSGHIYGQRLINFKVCTVPKRDRVNEEQPTKKRKSSGYAVSSGKRPCRSAESMPMNVPLKEEDVQEECSGSAGIQCERVSSGDTLPSGISCKLTMPDAASMNNVLHCAVNEIYRKMINDPDNSARYWKFINGIAKHQQSLPPKSDLN